MDQDDPIIEYFNKELEQREQRLHAAYRNRDLLEFTHGAEWFVEHVNAIFLEYGFSGQKTRYPSNSGIKDLDDYLNNTVNQVDWIRGCWEVDHNYLRDKMA